MDIYEILCLIGTPALCGGIITYIVGDIRRQRKETAALKMGVQALLRAQMISDYNKWTDKGYAPIYARENFENCWKQYEALGENGVMADIHDKFLELPTKEAKNER